MRADERFMDSLAKANVGKGGEGAAKSALIRHAAGAVMPAAEATHGGILAQRPNQGFGGGDVPNGFGNEGLGKLET